MIDLALRPKPKSEKYTLIWLCSTCFLIICTILFGGFTRLTNSGLSITEWKPIVGFILPLNEDMWHIEFAKYKLSPEYLKINFDISFEEFKKIFLIEYIHRNLARGIFTIFTIPWILFIAFKKIKPKDHLFFFLIFCAILLQALVGWLMVKSGLVTKPYVSHYRLSIHFMMSLLLYGMILWKIFTFYSMGTNYKQSADRIIFKSYRKFRIFFASFFVLFIFQLILGCFVAGLKAGYIYNTYPLMGSSFIPIEFFDHNFSSLMINFSDPVFVQFLHRILALIIFCYAIYLYIYQRFYMQTIVFTICFSLLLVFTLLQFIFGVLTLVLHIPILLALMHQFLAILIFSLLLYISYIMKSQ